MKEQKFSGVQDTLFIPLAARVLISQRFPEYFYDRESMKFKDLDQVQAINEKSPEYTAIASVARYYNMDRYTEEFLSRYPNGNVVNLGAGLDTQSSRIEGPKARFYAVDFPDVIRMREQILGKSEKETRIGCDITNMEWTEQLDRTKPSMFIVSGVFQYFKPEAVAEFLRNMKAVFPKGEMVFDATNEVGIRYAQRYVKKSGNREAMMYFYINDAEKFAEENKVTLLQARGFYDEARKIIGKKAGLYTRIAMKVADDKKRTLLLHIRFH